MNTPTASNPQLKKGKKGCLIAVIIFFSFSLFLGLLNNYGLLDNENNVKLSDNAKQIKETCGTTKEQSIAIEQVLLNCEILEIDAIEHDDLLDDMFSAGDTGYRIKSEGINNIILYLNSDKEVIIIRYASIDLFSNNTYKEKFSSFYLTTDQQAALQTSSEKYVKSILNSPSSAKFSWFDWQISKDYSTQIAMVSSYVDAKNAFGAEIRAYFTFLYQMEENSYSLIYFEFDNEIIVDNR